MAVLSRIRLRRSAAQLHALQQVEREIRATDPHSRRKYLREFSESYTQYKEIIAPEELDSELLNSDILLLGDYHALPRSQQCAAELVESLRSHNKAVVLSLEMIFARDQRHVDEWMGGGISDEQLRQRIRHDAEWGFDWEPLRSLLTRARAAGAKICGLDCMPRGDLRRIAIRDRHAASRIETIRLENPESVQVVLFGESHLAPQHLPKILRSLIPEARIRVVLQNIDPLYWQAIGEKVARVEAVRIDSDTFCVFNSTPLEKYESYRQCIDRWRQDRPRGRYVRPAFANLVEALLRSLHSKNLSAELIPDAVWIDDNQALQRLIAMPRRALLGTGATSAEGLSQPEVAAIQERLQEAGCCYVPRLNLLLARRFELQAIGEEAARFVCSAGWKEVGHPPGRERDFYRECLRRALVEYGAIALCPGKAPIHEDDLISLYGDDRLKLAHTIGCPEPEFVRLLDFVVLHRDYECNARRYRAVPDLISEGRLYGGEKFSFAVAWLGRLLGYEIYNAYLRGTITYRTVRSLFQRPNPNPKTAYFRIAGLCRSRRK
ncbi:MAG TPA: ChaN family lipoprotein [Terriglobales bacterium]